MKLFYSFSLSTFLLPSLPSFLPLFPRFLDIKAWRATCSFSLLHSFLLHEHTATSLFSYSWTFGFFLTTTTATPSPAPLIQRIAWESFLCISLPVFPRLHFQCPLWQTAPWSRLELFQGLLAACLAHLWIPQPHSSPGIRQPPSQDDSETLLSSCVFPEELDGSHCTASHLTSWPLP